MAELKYNFQGGFLGASLTAPSAGTSQAITNLFGAAPTFATLVSPDYIKLVLDNNEIVYLTAYTSGSKNGTITRGAEDATLWPPQTHASGTGTWGNVPTVADFSALDPVNAVGTSGSTQTLIAEVMNRYVLSANCTFTLPPAVAGSSFTASFIQPASGGPYTVTITSADYGAAGTPTFSTAANAKDIVTGYCDDGSTWDVFFSGAGF